ncbi:TPA: hypothetical protein I7730_14225 [Vibrio vulnificus]|uniref:Uncharacterized protein n=1 Tax=Vibrio vulnificus TaxID=672 RepID=A0A8H9N185_VIBVL|nr:hypothetical protein [Vibrio vulnificus]
MLDLQGVNLITPSNVRGSSHIEHSTDTKKAAESFTSYYIEQMLNTSMSKTSGVTGEEKPPATMQIEAMLNRQLSTNLSKNNPLTDTIERELLK